jgi:DNA invertase Pin-like site-specific DNA recombinase
MMIYAYQRLSAFEQDSDPDSPVGFSDPDELAQIINYCKTQGWAEPTWIRESSRDWQAGFSQRLSAEHKLADHKADGWRPEPGSDVVVYSLQRLVNGAQDLSLTLDWMREHDVCLHVVEFKAELSQTRTLTRARVDFDIILASLARIERRRGAERMRKVKHEQRSKGRFLGGSKPFGYMVHSNGKLVENPLEQRVLKQIRQLRRQGCSLRVIARKVSTPIAPISFKTVQRVLQREESDGQQTQQGVKR